MVRGPLALALALALALPRLLACPDAPAPRAVGRRWLSAATSATPSSGDDLPSGNELVWVGRASSASKGLGLFARRDIAKGECVLTLHWGHDGQGAVFSHVYSSLDELADELAASVTSTASAPDGDATDSAAYARSVLAHSVPGVSGRVYTFSDSAIVAYENHR